jgi:hypothetical protein
VAAAERTAARAVVGHAKSPAGDVDPKRLFDPMVTATVLIRPARDQFWRTLLALPSRWLPPDMARRPPDLVQ